MNWKRSKKKCAIKNKKKLKQQEINMKRIEQKNTIKKEKTQASLIVTEIRLNFRFALQITKCMRTAKIGPDLRFTYRPTAVG